MSYHREIPRDLFNEASLLKCLGRLALLAEDRRIPGLRVEYGGSPFDVEQDTSNGDIYCTSLVFFYKGDPMYLIRPLNSRDPWPLYWANVEPEPMALFNDQGECQLPST